LDSLEESSAGVSEGVSTVDSSLGKVVVLWAAFSVVDSAGGLSVDSLVSAVLGSSTAMFSTGVSVVLGSVTAMVVIGSSRKDGEGCIVAERVYLGRDS
jgi:hypothetical protein